MKYAPLKGVHDLINQDADDIYRIISLTSLCANTYGYTPIIVPTIESTSLYQREQKDSSDMVTKEMYTFLDKGNRSISLRPEFTAGVLRAVISNKMHTQKELPIKLYYQGSCFRYERPQAGRYREFSQLGVEAIDEPSIYLDLEVLLLGCAMLYRLDLDFPFKVKVNYLPSKEGRKKYVEALKKYFKPHLENMCLDCKNRYKTNPLRILDCKVEEDKKLIKKAPKISDFYTEEEREKVELIKDVLKEEEIKFEIDETLVRGLDYYSGLVFEYVVDNKVGDEVGSIGGGGHYDSLVEELGGPSNLEGVGFSFGMERLLRCYQELPNYMPRTGHILFSFIPLNEEGIDVAFSLVNVVRSFGHMPCSMPYKVKSLKAGLRKASNEKASYAVIIGEDEIKKEIVTVKDLHTGTQEEVSVDHFLDYVVSLIQERTMKMFDDGEKKKPKNKKN